MGVDVFGPLFPSVSLLTDVPPQPRAGPRRAAVPGRASSRLRGSPTADRGTARPPPTYSLAPPRGRPRTQPGAGGGGRGERRPRCGREGPSVPGRAPSPPRSTGAALRRAGGKRAAGGAREPCGGQHRPLPPPNPPPASARAGPHVARAPVKSRQPPRARHWRRQRPPAPLLPLRRSRAARPASRPDPASLPPSAMVRWLGTSHPPRSARRHPSAEGRRLP